MTGVRHCPTCGKQASYVAGSVIFPRKTSWHLHAFWVCWECARVRFPESMWLRFKRDQHEAQWNLEREEIDGEDWLADATAT